MTFKVASRTREKTTTTGTGTIDLGGVLHPNERTFVEAIGDGYQTSYVLLSGDGIGVEEGIGTVTDGSPPTLSRRVVRSTNDDAAIDLTGQSSVFCAAIPGVTPSAGPSWVMSVAVATTGALPANTYDNGDLGQGATLTATANGLLTLDGVDMVVDYRVLVKDEAAPVHNGVYVVTHPGDSGAPYVLTRAADYDDETEIYQADCVAVGGAGQSNGRTLWIMYTGATAIIVGTAELNFSLIGVRNSEGLDLIGADPGDMLVRGPTEWAALAPGADGEVLTVVSGLPSWEDAASGGGGALDDLTDVTITSPAEDDVLVLVSGNWVNKRQRYVIGASLSGALTASQNILLHRFATAVTIPADFGAYLGLASQAGGTANATADTVINVDKAATAAPNTFTNVGTITIGSGGVTPTFATASHAAVDFDQGDVLRIQGPSSADATFAGFYATLVGFET